MNTLTRDEFVSSVSCLSGSVYYLHQRFAVPMIDPLSSAEETLQRLRIRLAILMEEVGEHARELNQGDLGKAAREIADVAFVAMGTLLVFDAAGREACIEVAEKNDRKTAETHAIDGTSGKLLRRVASP